LDTPFFVAGFCWQDAEKLLEMMKPVNP